MLLTGLWTGVTVMVGSSAKKVSAFVPEAVSLSAFLMVTASR